MRFVLCLAVLAAFAAGCGPSGDNSAISLYPTSGKVLLANGQPAKGAIIKFIGKGQEGGPNGIGVLDSTGNFTLKSLERDGMAPGTYTVVLDPVSPHSKITDADRAAGKSSIPRKYWSDETSKLVAAVKAETNTLELKLDEK
jgi:hypothetical protein